MLKFLGEILSNNKIKLWQDIKSGKTYSVGKQSKQHHVQNEQVNNNAAKLFLHIKVKW